VAFETSCRIDPVPLVEEVTNICAFWFRCRERAPPLRVFFWKEEWKEAPNVD
jgi:hypothetical protein